MGLRRLAGVGRLRDRARRRLRLGLGRAAALRQRVVDPRPRRQLPARRRRPQPVPDPAHLGPVVGGDPVVGDAGARPRPQLLPDAGDRADRDARGLHGPGPAPVRPLLRPDADPVLLPRRGLGGRARPGRGDDQDDHLHAGRVALDAGGGDRDRGAERRRGGRAHLLAGDAAVGPARGRLPVLDLLLLRARLPGEDAGVPRPRLDARRLPRLPAAGAGAARRRALEGGRLRVPAGGAAALPRRRGALPDARC